MLGSQRYKLPLKKLKYTKAIFPTGRGGLSICEMLRISHFLEDRVTDGGKFAASRAGHRFTPQKYYFSIASIHFSYRMSNSQGLAWLEGIAKFVKIISPRRISKAGPSGL
jgi:hypothetical protein